MLFTPHFCFSHHFSGKVWNTVTLPGQDLLFIEVRDDVSFQVKFYALNYMTNQFLWKDLVLKESWWLGLKAANKNTLLFDSYANKGNPDHKNLLALDIMSKVIRWEVEEFSFYDWDDNTIWGYSTKNDITPGTINIYSGHLTLEDWKGKLPIAKTSALNPVQFLEGTANYDTVKRFIEQKASHTLTIGVEYLELEKWIIVSVYIRENGSLANYLLVLNIEGKVLLQEMLGEKLEGLGTDTFFMLSGCLFFVKNKTELVAYKLYD